MQLIAISRKPFSVLWGMSDVSPGRICKFNSAAEPAMSNPVGDYFAPSSLPPRFGQICQFNPVILDSKLHYEIRDDSIVSWTPLYSDVSVASQKSYEENFQYIEWNSNPGYFKSVNLLLNKHKDILPSRSATPVCHHSIRAGPPSWVASANHQFPNLAGTSEKGNLPIWKIYRFLIDSDSRFLLLVTSAPLVTFFNPCCQLFPIVCNQKDNDIIPFLISSKHL